MVQVNALFHRVGDEDEWGTGFVTAAGSDGLPPGGVTAVTVTSPLGYTGTESGSEMLANSQFVDARVDLFASTAPRSGRPSAVPNHPPAAGALRTCRHQSSDHAPRALGWAEFDRRILPLDGRIR